MDTDSIASTVWAPPPPDLGFQARQVDVWKAFLPGQMGHLDRLEQTLSEPELVRAGRYIFARDRHRYVLARGILRVILSRYLQRSAHAIEITTGAEGKPRLREPELHELVQFNLSHSHDIAVFALASGRETGIDVEAIRPDVTTEEIVERFFTAAERAAWLALPPDQRHEAFFTCWTRKEAYVKARGRGLGIALDSFDVSLAPGLPAVLRSADSHRWALHSIHPAEGYVGAVVSEGQDSALRLWDFEALDPIP